MKVGVKTCCMSELRRRCAAGRLQLRGGAPATKWKLTKSCLLPRFQPLDIPREAFTLPFISFPSWQSCARSDRLSWLFQFATWQYTDVHKLSVQKWLFNNTVLPFFFFLRSVLKDLWAISGLLLVKSLSRQVEENECVGVMRDSHSEGCKRSKWERINRKLVAVSSLCLLFVTHWAELDRWTCGE